MTTDSGVLKIAPFFGQAHTIPAKTWVVYEPDFEVQRKQLRDAYLRQRGYMPGGFSITIGGTECFGLRYWDDVLPLWAYFEEALSRFLIDGEASFVMPDQPVTVGFDRQAYQAMRVRIDDEVVLICNELEFIAKMRDAIQRLRTFLESLGET